MAARSCARSTTLRRRGLDRDDEGRYYHRLSRVNTEPAARSRNRSEQESRMQPMLDAIVRAQASRPPAGAGNRDQGRHGPLDGQRRHPDGDGERLFQGDRHQGQLEDLQSSATAMASLAQGQLNIIAGGVSAGYFNALEKNLPIIITVDRVTTPIRHNLMVRADLKDQIKDIKDAQGQGHRQQRAGIDLDLRDRQDPGQRRTCLQRRRDQEHPVPAICSRLDQQGGRCSADHPAIHLQSRGARASRSPSWRPTISSSRTR